MKATETLSDFYQYHNKDYAGAGEFNVYRIEDFCKTGSLPPTRRDFYKISILLEGEGLLSYSDKVIHIKDKVITFTNPMIPYSFEPISDGMSGYFCLFNEAFINSHLKIESLSASPLFKVGGNHVLMPGEQSMMFMSGVFEQMMTEMQSAYINKYDLLRSYVQIIMHEALKMEPATGLYQPGNSSARISTLFMELLERQFPVNSPLQTMMLKNANEFAAQLSVHTNHLNRALKETTGCTTSQLIANRTVKEAKALLLHSNWDISQIGYVLGFEHPSNFNIFFKKHTGHTPNHFRRQVVVMA